MATAQEMYDAAILQACEDHLTRVNAACRARVSIVSKAKIFSEHDPSTYMARITAYAAAKEQYEKAIRSSDKRRLQEEAEAMAALRATKRTSGRCTEAADNGTLGSQQLDPRR